jgi:hypothetical protein
MSDYRSNYSTEQEVELRGFEPLTSCMPSAGRQSTHVYRRRSPSRSVCASPARSALVAVLPRCTHPQPSSPARPTVLEGRGQIRCAQMHGRPIDTLATHGFYSSAEKSTSELAICATFGRLGE